METVTNAANSAVSAASKAIWGDQSATGTDSTTETSDSTVGHEKPTTQEPVSGETGNTKKGEPFDGGNLDSTNTETTKPISDDTTTTEVAKDASNTTDNTDTSNVAQKSGTEASDNPSTEHQGAADPKDEPEGRENDAIKATKKEAEDAAKVDTSGPGPKPLSEIHKSGGHAGGSAGPTGKDEEDGPQKESQGEGTGEKYVKSSGMKADGGDFDATKPGAGREADRLLEEKGIHREEGKSEPAEDPLEEKTGKKSLGEKIKAKFHKS